MRAADLVDIRTCKAIISQVVSNGDDLIDALYNATTSETSTRGFEAGLRDICQYVIEHGGIDRAQAARYMVAHNTEHEIVASRISQVSVSHQVS